MPQKCDVPCCGGISTEDDTISFHRLSQRAGKHVMKKWRDFCGGKLVWPTICSNHFQPEDFTRTAVFMKMFPGARQTLRSDAVPSIPEFQDPQSLHHNVVVLKISPPASPPMPIDQSPESSSPPMSSALEQHIGMHSCSSFWFQQLKDYKKQFSIMRDEIEYLKNENNRLRQEKLYLSRCLEENTADLEEARTIENLLKSVFTENQLDLILKRKERVRWKPKEIQVALAIRNLSETCYNFLREKLNFPLPCQTSLQNWSKKLNIESVVDDSANFDEDKICVLSSDEVHIKKSYEYVKEEDETWEPFEQTQRKYKKTGKKNLLEKLTETGDYIPLNSKSSPKPSTSPKAGPSRKRLRESDSEDDDSESLKLVPNTLTKTFRNNFAKVTNVVKTIENDQIKPIEASDEPEQVLDNPEQGSNMPDNESICDSTTQNEEEKEISMDLVKEETADPLDCSDVVVVSAYQNVTPRQVASEKPDDSIEIIPVIDDNSSDEETVITINETADDSVIFVREEMGSAKPQVKTPNIKKGKMFSPGKFSKKPNHPKHKNQGPIASSSQIQTGKESVESGSKTYQNPKKIKIMKETGSSTGGKEPRFIVIDGSNVAFHHSLMKKVFSVEGLKIAIDYFEEKGHEVVAVVPQFRSRKNYSTNPELLKDLNLKGKVIFSPVKHIRGFTLSSYDDLLIMQVAEKNKGVIISNDNFADLLGQNIQWDTIIGTRVVGFTWFKNQFFLPLDPYGRDGPKIDEILYQ